MLKRHIYANMLGQRHIYETKIVPQTVHVLCIMDPHISSLATTFALKSIALNANQLLLSCLVSNFYIFFAFSVGDTRVCLWCEHVNLNPLFLIRRERKRMQTSFSLSLLDEYKNSSLLTATKYKIWITNFLYYF